MSIIDKNNIVKKDESKDNQDINSIQDNQDNNSIQDNSQIELENIENIESKIIEEHLVDQPKPGLKDPLKKKNWVTEKCGSMCNLFK